MNENHTQQPRPRMQLRTPVGTGSNLFSVTPRRTQLRIRPGPGPSPSTTPRTVRHALQDITMQLDGQAEEEEDITDIDEDVYTADLQVEEETPAALAEASIEAGSPIPSQQRRRMRSYTMRLSRSASTYTPTHARGSSDTASMISVAGRMVGRMETGVTGSPRSFVHRSSVHGPETRIDEMAYGGGGGGGGGVETGDVNDTDRMQID
ncbi:hypothetical protein F5Y14DRAFT_396688 [Nemania sp. NC0429]|nr:hypothetical protein F5Y14DRAFT_396688 [Nemania sp. NC0429]